MKQDLIERTLAEDERPWSEIESASRFVVSDEQGFVGTESVLNTPAVIWITSPGHLARSFVCIDDTGFKLPDRIQLEGAPQLKVKVSSSGGEPVGKALVSQCVDLWDKPTDSASPATIAARLFQRRVSTNGLGEVELAALGDYQHLVASQGDLISQPWIGRQPASPHMVLRGAFSASGTVPGHPGGLASEPDDRVIVTALVDNSLENVGSARVRSDGTWGPVSLPCVAASEYRFLMDSTVWLPVVVRRPPARPGEFVRVDFPGEKGISLPVLVLDQAGGPIEGVATTVSTEVDGVSLGASRFTNAAGLATINNIRPGFFTISTLKRGYCSTQTPRMEMYQDATGPYRIELSSGGDLRGHCKSGGSAVSTFEVQYWQDNLRNHGVRHFADRPDGSYEVFDLPLGKTSVLAFSRDHPHGPEQVVEIEAGQTAELEIELPDAVVGRGRVVNASTGDPIPRATVQPMMQVGLNNFGPWGPPRECAPDGSFEFPGFSPGANIIMVSANGFASLAASASGTSPAGIEFGFVTLHRAGSLDVTLVCDPDLNPERFTVGLDKRDYVAPVPFKSTGKMTFEHLTPGLYSVDVSLGLAGSLQAMTTTQAGQATSVVIDHRRARTLSLELVAEPGGVVPADTYARTSYVDAAGGFVSFSTWFDEKHTVDLSRIPADRMVIDVGDQKGAILATRWITSSRDKAEVIRFTLGEQRPTFRVVDTAHRPLRDVVVGFEQLHDGAGWQLALRTDEKGEVQLGSLQTDHLTIMIRSDDGCRWFETVPIPAKLDQPIELVLDAPLTLNLQALDGTTPLPALNIDLMDAVDAGFILQQPVTDEQGRARCSKLCDQPFQVRVDVMGLWPTKVVVRPSQAETTVPIQVRRLGGVRLQATVVGTPLRKKPIGLRSIEFDADVATWISAGRVQSSSEALTTDADGRLQVEGLPNGRYIWTARNSSDELVAGEFVVPPRASATVDIKLP